MLRTRTLLRREGIEIADVACHHRAGRGHDHEQTGGFALVFVRRGRFARSVDGARALLDPTVAYCMNPNEVQRYDHLDDQGDDCTALFLAPSVIASVWGGDPVFPGGPLPSAPAIDLEHRLLLASVRGRSDPEGLVERTLTLVADALGQSDPHRVASGRPATARAKAALADGAREALAADPSLTLTDLALSLSVSPHHLSRTFRSVTGETISRHRIRLRVRDALERLAGGEHDLARVAADSGFADHSHLCRTLQRETGLVPSAIREAVA